MKTNEAIKELKSKIAKLEELEEAANLADVAYEQNPESEEAAKAFDEAYEKEFSAFMEVSTLLADLLGIDIKTAHAMVNGKRTALLSILGAV